MIGMDVLLSLSALVVDGDADPGIGIFGQIGITIAVIIVAGILWLIALIAILSSSHYTVGGKLLWILAALPYPIVGPLAYFVLGRHARIVKDEHAAVVAVPKTP